MSASAINLADFQRDSVEDLERRATLIEAEAQVTEQRAIEMGCHAITLYAEAGKLRIQASRLRYHIQYNALMQAAGAGE